jgi:hypothetical protein
MHKLTGTIIASLLLQAPALFVPAQEWNLAKEKDNIRLYTRRETNSSFKSFRGEAEILADMEKVGALIGNPSNSDWWGDDVHEIKVLYFEKGKHIRYYFVYDVPWPFADRDLVADVCISRDSVSGVQTVFSQPLPDIVPEKPGIIRVKRFWQRWTIRPLHNGMIHLTLEGYVDPAGDVPAWLYNMIIVDIPLRLLREVRKRVQQE